MPTKTDTTTVLPHAALELCSGPVVSHIMAGWLWRAAADESTGLGSAAQVEIHSYICSGMLGHQMLVEIPRLLLPDGTGCRIMAPASSYGLSESDRAPFAHLHIAERYANLVLVGLTDNSSQLVQTLARWFVDKRLAVSPKQPAAWPVSPMAQPNAPHHRMPIAA